MVFLHIGDLWLLGYGKLVAGMFWFLAAGLGILFTFVLEAPSE